MTLGFCLVKYLLEMQNLERFREAVTKCESKEQTHCYSGTRFEVGLSRKLKQFEGDRQFDACKIIQPITPTNIQPVLKAMENVLGYSFCLNFFLAGYENWPDYLI